MLHDALSKNSKKLTLQLDIRQVKSESIRQLKKELNGFKGDKLLFFDVIDSEKQLKLTLASRKQKVAISNELLSHLEEKRWRYKLNWLDITIHNISISKFDCSWQCHIF